MNPRFRHLVVLGVWLFLLLSVSRAGDWPQWRGPERTGWITQGAPFPKEIRAEPKVVWRSEIGGGFSSPVVAAGRLVYLDALQQKEVVHLLDANTGHELWSVAFADAFQDEWGAGPRSTPIIDGDRIYVQSCNGEFRCLSLSDGKTLWRTSFDKDFGAVFLGNKAREGAAIRRGNNGCGVIEGDRIILPVGSTQGASLVCLEKLTGKVLWNSGNDEMAYSSLMIATIAGKREVVALTAEALTGTDLPDGKILWRVPLRTNAKRHAATPVIFGDTIIANSFTIGTVCYKITKQDAAQQATQLWANKEMKINLASPVLVGHYLFSHGPDKDYVCIDASTGSLTWQQKGFGDNVSSTIAFGHDLLVLTDRGELVMLASDSAQYTEKSRVQICGKTWSHPAYADGKLYVREGVDRAWKLTCFDLMP
ncbi:MAG: hypothetical protein JWR26_3276 [Pedosphaera sp.]|nr:hypothetical protein [Pedosphaera sp.]